MAGCLVTPPAVFASLFPYGYVCLSVQLIYSLYYPFLAMVGLVVQPIIFISLFLQGYVCLVAQPIIYIVFVSLFLAMVGLVVQCIVCLPVSRLW